MQFAIFSFRIVWEVAAGNASAIVDTVLIAILHTVLVLRVSFRAHI